MPIRKRIVLNGKEVEAWIPDSKRKNAAGKELERLLRRAVDRKMIMEGKASA
ncbi:MAG: hypothetical protein L6243_06585 [Candidatus Altiarchaeales archaeon]|nr:hypothetical protein [Candidatus Altiarchaeota archaeon]MBU4341992.1 hypothetical protein [Candidatus Altiarchaeota archaeon]MBU4437634.1 hypothetical protein [Candidatus Altiarchaeota archaeon]MCG2783238.1 hypothetical protein [Candidatus Altiarchaeales archaeon]